MTNSFVNTILNCCTECPVALFAYNGSYKTMRLADKEGKIKNMARVDALIKSDTTCLVGVYHATAGISAKDIKGYVAEDIAFIEAH